MSKHKDILRFIRKFTDLVDPEPFESGLCYHFAKTLSDLFDGYPVYDRINCHFMAHVDGSFYDINGEVPDVEDMRGITSWTNIQWDDPDLAENIRYNCIYLDSAGWSKLNDR